MTVPSSNISAIWKKVSMASISPKRTTGFTVVALILLILLGGMGWIMITEKEEYLVQRNFRLLEMWSQDIVFKIEGYQQVFKFSAKGILEGLHSDTEYKKLKNGERSRFLRTHISPPNTSPKKPEDHSKKHIELLKKLSPWPCPPKQGATLKVDENQPKIIQNLERHLIGMCRTEGLTQIILSIPEETSNDTEKFQLSVIHSQSPTIIRLTYSTTSDHGEENIKIIGDIELGKFFKRLTNEPIFDEVLLFESSEAKVKHQPLIFRSGSQEFSWTDSQAIIDRLSTATSFLGSLLGNPRDSSKVTELFIKNDSPNQFLIDVPGKTNNVFTLPVIVPANKGTNWRLVGMVDHDTFQNNYLAISSSLLLGIMFLILGLVLAIPLIYLKTMGSTDPLRVSHVLTAILAAFLGTGLFTVLILDIAVYHEGTSTLRERLEASAQAIKDNVDMELKNILFTLDHFNKSKSLYDDIAKISQKAEKRKVGHRPVLLEVLEDQENPGNPVNRQCNALPDNERQNCYPDFLMAFWMDQDGSLRINWAKEQDLGITTNLLLGDREYVKTVLGNFENLWRIPFETKDETTSANYQFFLEPIISRTTGINSVVASMPSIDETSQWAHWVATMEFTFHPLMDHVVLPPGTGVNTVQISTPSMLGTSEQRGVAAMEFTFLSLMDHVVLPPGIGFAVIEKNTHQVLFHSKEGRNLREAFLVETDQNSKLRDLFAAQTAGHADGSYWGKSTSFYTLPLNPLPWALVVYRDKEILRSVNLFGLLIAGGLYGLWSLIVYGIAWVLLLRTPGHRKFVFMWPNSDNNHHYVTLIKINLVVFILGLPGVWLLSGQPGWQLLTGLVLIPASYLLGAFFFVKNFSSKRLAERDTNNRWEWSKKFVQQARSIFEARSVLFIREHGKKVRTLLAAVFTIPPKENFSLFTFPNSYAYLATSFLLVFAVIPALSCFTSVFHKEMTLLTQYQLLETFKTFQGSGKQQTLQSQKFSPSPQTLTKIAFKASCEVPPPKTNEETHFEPSYGFYPDFFLETTWTECEITNTSDTHTNEPGVFDQKFDTHKPGMFDQLFAVMSQPFLPLLKNVPLFWAFLGESWPSNTTEQRTIKWKKDKGQVTAFFSENHTLVSATFPLRPWFLAGNLSHFHTPTLGNLPMYLFLLILALLYLLWLFKIPKFIATRTVFLDYPIPHKIPIQNLFGPTSQASPCFNRLILGFPGQGKTPMAHKYNKEQEIHLKQTNAPVHVLYFDLKAISPEQWKYALSQKISSLHLQDHHSLHVTVDHLEQRWKDPEINRQKLELLGWLLTRSNHKTDAPDTTSPPDQEASQAFKLGDLMIKVLTKFLSPKNS